MKKYLLGLLVCLFFGNFISGQTLCTFSYSSNNGKWYMDITIEEVIVHADPATICLSGYDYWLEIIYSTDTNMDEGDHQDHWVDGYFECTDGQPQFQMEYNVTSASAFTDTIFRSLPDCATANQITLGCLTFCYDINGPNGVNREQGCIDCNEEIILPVTYGEFLASAEENYVDLEWNTLTEHNNSHFEVMRSGDGQGFELIGTVQGNNNSKTRSEYSFRDQQPLYGMNYYRLNQVDRDGSSEKSEIRSVEFNSERVSGIQVIPNPVSGQNSILVEGSDFNEVFLYSVDGKLQSRSVNPDGDSSLNVDVSTLSQGLYFIKTDNGTQTKFIVR